MVVIYIGYVTPVRNGKRDQLCWRQTFYVSIYLQLYSSQEKLHDKASSWHLGSKIKLYYFWRQLGTILKLFLWKWFSDIYDMKLYTVWMKSPVPSSSLPQVQIGNNSAEAKSVQNWLRGNPSWCYSITLLRTHQNSFIVAKSKIQNAKFLYCV